MWTLGLRESQREELSSVVRQPYEELRRSGFTSYDDIVRFAAKTAHERGDIPQILDKDFVFLGKPFRELPPDEYQQAHSIIMERHCALNWLCGFAPGNRWDETPTDT